MYYIVVVHAALVFMEWYGIWIHTLSALAHSKIQHCALVIPYIKTLILIYLRFLSISVFHNLRLSC